MNVLKSAFKTNIKHHIVTALIIVTVIILAGLFGTLLVESKAQMHHAVSGIYSYSQGGIVFLTIGLTSITLFTSYMVIKVRNDDLALKLKSEQRYKEFLEQLNEI